MLKIVDDSVIRYAFGDNTLNVSYVFSPSVSTTKDVESWTREDRRVVKRETLRSGLYIMHNDGKLQNYGGKVTKFRILRTATYSRVIIDFESKLKSTITLRENDH